MGQEQRPPFAYSGGFLSALAGLSEVAPVRVFTGTAQIPSLGTVAFCRTALGNAMGGAVVGVYFYLDSEDYQTSPVSLVQLSAQAGQSAAGVSAAAVGGSPWNMQLGLERNPFYFPAPYSISWRQNSDVGLQVTNNETFTVYAEGILVVAAWPSDALRQAQDELDARDGSVFGGGSGRLFS